MKRRGWKIGNMKLDTFGRKFVRAVNTGAIPTRVQAERVLARAKRKWGDRLQVTA